MSLRSNSRYITINTPDGNVFKSSMQSLPDSITQDTIYGKNIIHIFYKTSFTGRYMKNVESGINTYLNLNSRGSGFPKCRYKMDVTVLLSTPQGYEWLTINPFDRFNITSTSFDIVEDKILDFFLCYLSKNPYFYYGKGEPGSGSATIVCFFLLIDKYDLNTSTYKYYQNLNSQLNSSNRMFDPVINQIEGNIYNETNTKDKAFGYFEVSYSPNLYYKCQYDAKDVWLTKKDSLQGYSRDGLSRCPPPFYTN